MRAPQVPEQRSRGKQPLPSSVQLDPTSRPLAEPPLSWEPTEGTASQPRAPTFGAVTEVPSYHLVYLKVSQRFNLTVHTRIGAADTSGTHGEQAMSSAQQTAANGEPHSPEHFSK